MACVECFGIVMGTVQVLLTADTVTKELELMYIHLRSASF